MKTLTPVALIVAAIGLFYLYINPQYQEVKDLRVKSEAYDTAIESAKTVVAQRNELVAKRNAFNPQDLKNLQTMLPDSVDPIRLIVDVNNVVRQHGSVLKSLQLLSDQSANAKSAKTEGKQYNTTVLTVGITGSYENFKQILSDFQKDLQLIDITQLSIKPDEKSSQYVYTLQLQAYSLKQ